MWTQSEVAARIERINRQLDAIRITVGDVTYKEGTLADEKKRFEELEAQTRDASFVQQLRDKAKEAKELEEQREQLHVELTSLNTQSSVRAQLQLKRTESRKKEEAVDSLSVFQ